MFTWKFCAFLWLICVHSTFQYETEANLSNHKLSGLIQWKYEKRPFCNAFTGCGKKRTSLPAFPPYPLVKRQNDVVDEQQNVQNEELSQGLSDLIDINAEPAVENVQKQIMSQAKLFEAIKEASKEIFRQKNQQRLRNAEQKLKMDNESAENLQSNG